jgi:tetratricopeptide (TPR) repeat protein
MLSRSPRKTMLVVLALLLLATPLLAQAWKGRGRLQGQVNGPDGRPVEGAKITLRIGSDGVDPAKEGPASVTTDAKGRWSILGLAGGSWGILIEKEGFQPSEGLVKVNESGPPPQPIRVDLKAPSVQQQQQAAQDDAGSQAKQALDQGNALLEAGRYAEARAQYETAMAKVDAELHPAILRAIAKTWYEEKQPDKAVATLEQALQLKPDDVESLKLVINLLVAQGKEKEAQTYMARLPQGQTVDADTLLNVGIKYYNEQKLDDALTQFDRVVKENPNLADAYYYRGLVYLNQGKTAEAKADFQKVLEIDPKHPQAADVREYLSSL